MSTPLQDISLWGILSEARRIIKANRNHFTILSLILLLPYSFLLLIYPTIFPIGSQSNPTFLLILYWIVLCVFSLSATGTIIYSTFHGYYNQPLDLITSLKSSSYSFFPLFSTSIVLQLIISAISFVVGIPAGILAVLFYSWLETNDTDSSYKDVYFTLTIILVVLITSVYATYITLNCFVANVIVVVESKWGYEPLRRSAYLMKGAKLVGFKMMMLGLLNSLFVWSCFWNSWKADKDGLWVWIFKMVAGSCWITVVTKYCLAFNVVLYIYCKEMHGELAMETQAEEYVSLHIDDYGNKSVVVVDV